MKNQSLQTALDELPDDAPEAMDEIVDPDLEFISGGQRAVPNDCDDFTHCGTFKNP
ncbi:hypothetical protein [Chromobacterium vaccinii]|uniref:hypothetical protein n=1 Tax=Chromobacterium vaccinii TaxID=1108595 RepID=UPI001E44655A|nr:hypothetical protein [Chromobacterium vaccinii]MCD4502311.1 hypothetical protein [Chromobacterium vaccinii]